MIRRSPYEVRIKRSAERELDRLPKPTFKRIQTAILSLEDDPRPHGVQKLRGLNEYRIRSGDYRILYTIDDDARTVEIMAVGHRRDVYRGL